MFSALADLSHGIDHQNMSHDHDHDQHTRSHDHCEHQLPNHENDKFHVLPFIDHEIGHKMDNHKNKKRRRRKKRKLQTTSIVDVNATTANTTPTTNADRCFSRDEIRRIETITEKAFTLDGFALENGTNSVNPKFCTPTNSFFEQDIQGQHVWINPPHDKLHQAILHYMTQKQKSPYDTSACFLVPVNNRFKFLNYVTRNMHLIAEFGNNTPLFSIDGYTPNQCLPYRLRVYYDPPCPMPTVFTVDNIDFNNPIKIKLKSTHTLQFDVVLNSIRETATCLVDTGAEPCKIDNIIYPVYISQEYCLKNNIKFTANNDVSLIPIDGGTNIKICGTCKISFKHGHYKDLLDAIVIPMASSYDVILNDKWMTMYKAYIDYQSKVIHFKVRNRYYTMRAKRIIRDTKPSQTPSVNFISSRNCNKHDTFYLATVQFFTSNPNHDIQHDAIIQDLIVSYPTVFTDTPIYGGSQIQSHHEVIPLQTDARPPYRPMFRYSPLEIAEMEKQIKELLELGYIQPSTSPYGAPVLFVKKPRSDKLRMCIDYRAINKLTIKNKYPLPRIDTILDTLSGATIFSSIDLRQAYHQIKLLPSDVPKTAFRSPFGHYEYLTLSFGLTNAPSAFQALMNDMFREYLGKFVLAYLDDILIFSRTHDEHIQHIKIVLDILKANKLTVAIEKCDFFKKELFYLGFIITDKGIQVDPAKITAIQKFPAPTDVSALRSFLGMTGFFRKFIKNYAALTFSLTDLLKKDKPFLWTEECVTAFEALKSALCNAPILKLPDFDSDSPFTIYTDASYKGIGGILMQNGHVVAYESRKLSCHELNYPPTEIEMLAVIHCIKLWRCYIEGRETHIYTDHKPNVTFSTQAALSRRQSAWISELQSYNLIWHYEKGDKMIADPLSRHPVNDATHKQVLLGVMQRAISSIEPSNLLNLLSKSYKKDAWFNDPNNVSKFIKKNDLYYNGSCIVVPDDENIKRIILHDVHNLPLSGHPGREKTLKLLSRKFYWSKMYEDAKFYVKHCDICQRNKRMYGKSHGMLLPLPIPDNTWESISMDFVVKLPLTPNNHDTILVIVDRLSKMTHLIPCNERITAVDLAQLFVDNIVKLHGIPTQIITDRGSLFMSNFWSHFTKILQIKRSLSTAYHPQTDGQTERVNQIMEDMLRHYVRSDQTNWDKLLGLVEFAINNSYHESIKTTPFSLIYVKPPKLPIVSIHGVDDASPSALEYAHTVHDLLKFAKQCLTDAQQRYKHYADNKRMHIQFNKDDKILLSTKNLTLKMIGSSKFMPRFIGPYRIMEQINQVTYRVKLPSELGIHNVFHVSLLKPYFQDNDYQPPPAPVIIDDKPFYVVEQILNHRDVRRGKRSERQYLVKWLNYGPEHNTWEPLSSFGSNDLIKTYLSSLQENIKLPKRPLKRRRK